MRIATGHGEKKPRGAARRFGIFIAIFFTTHLMALAQSNSPGSSLGPRQAATLRTQQKSKIPSPFWVLTPLKPEGLEVPYQPFTSRQYLRWFTTNTTDPATLAGGIFQAALGTVPDRPKEYGPHWAGFADRYGIGMTRSVTGNAIQAGLGMMLREDPRYFRAPERPFRSRVGNVVRLAFIARGFDGSFGPAYARYVAILGDNFLSNSWRVHSEANSRDALLRTSEGFGGVLASNAFEEFWPDVKKRVFHRFH
jgi:hypothetical protein